MKRLLPVFCLVGLAWSCLVGDASAKPSNQRQTNSATSAVTKTLKGIGNGTTKLVRGTLDVVTLKPLREKKTAKLDPPPQPWLNNSTKKKKEEKTSFWDSLFSSKEKEPKRVNTMRDFVGLERPR